jgi:hypothetical protein
MLLYVAGLTRVDIANAVCFVSQYCHNPLVTDWKNVVHILQYLKATKDYCLCFSKSGQNLKAYVDADFANNKDDSVSISGYVFVLCNAAVFWRSKKQRVDVASSSTFAEYVAMYECSTDLVWLKEFLKEINQANFVSEPCKVYADNVGAMCIAKSEAVSDQTKHIRVKYHYVRNLVKRGEIAFEYVKSTTNVADILTKPLSGARTREFAHSLGVS